MPKDGNYGMQALEPDDGNTTCEFEYSQPEFPTRYQIVIYEDDLTPVFYAWSEDELIWVTITPEVMPREAVQALKIAVWLEMKGREINSLKDELFPEMRLNMKGRK